MDSDPILNCMEWRRKSELDEPYCAVHNVDCPLHGHTGDPWVLHINPMRVPTGWVCPEAVIEISEYLTQAEEYKDKNTPSAAGMVTDHEYVIIDAFDKQGWPDEADQVRMSGAESLTLEQIDGAIHCIEQQQHSLPDIAESVVENIIEFHNEHTHDSR